MPHTNDNLTSEPATENASTMPHTNDIFTSESATEDDSEMRALFQRCIVKRVIFEIELACELEKEIKERIEALQEFRNNPPIVHRSSLGPDAKDLECPICFYNYWAPRTLEGEPPEAAEFPVRLPCGHVFGYICISEWLNDNRTCPICKAEMERTVDIAKQVLEKLHRREKIELAIENLWAVWSSFWTMRDTVNRDGLRTIANRLSRDPDGIVERELKEIDRRIRVMEEVVSDEENIDAPTLFKEVPRLIAPTDRAAMYVLLSTLIRARYYPWAVRLRSG